MITEYDLTRVIGHDFQAEIYAQKAEMMAEIAECQSVSGDVALRIFAELIRRGK